MNPDRARAGGRTWLKFPCPFYGDGGCRIYEVRPVVCRRCPFAPSLGVMHTNICYGKKDRGGHIGEAKGLAEGAGADAAQQRVARARSNMVSTGALASLGFWDVDVMVLTQRGRPVAMLKSLDDDSHVRTRLCQYEALSNGKGAYIAKQLVLSKMRGQNIVLKKHDLKLHDEEAISSKIEKLDSSDLEHIRKKLNAIEGHFTKSYFNQIFRLLPENLRPEGRKKFKAYDGTNNIFNLAYEVLQWKVHRAIIKAKLEPYLGFLHSVQFGKPSLVCDLQELYRYIVDNFLIKYCQDLRKKDFITKTESISRKRKAKREYLNNAETHQMMKEFEMYFETKVDIPLMGHGKRQRIETLINEEALLLAKYLRNERKIWVPRIASV